MEITIIICSTLVLLELISSLRKFFLRPFTEEIIETKEFEEYGGGWQVIRRTYKNGTVKIYTKPIKCSWIAQR